MFIKTYNVDGNNLNEFNDNVKQGTGMVAYTADWCGHCKNLKPHWDKFQNRCKRKKTIKPVTVAHCDVPKYQSQAFGANTVRGFPTIIAFKDGKEVSRFSQLDGNRENPKDLEKFLNKFIKMNKKRGRRNSVNNTKKKPGSFLIFFLFHKATSTHTHTHTQISIHAILYNFLQYLISSPFSFSSSLRALRFFRFL